MWQRRPMRLFSGFSAAGLVMFIYEYVANPYDPALTGTAAYGHTYPGELSLVLRMSAVEIVAAAMVLRPWSYNRSWGRALVAVLLLTPWLMLWGVLGLHAGPATHAHTTWLVGLWLGLAVAAARGALTSDTVGEHSSRAAP